MERAGDILKAILAEGVLRSGHKYISLFGGWEDVVGEPLCDHTRAIDVQRGSLVVEVDHPGWFQMLQFREKQILRRR